MLKSLPITVISLLLASSCSTYQYGTVSSSGMLMNDKNEFVYENDSLRLVYNFCGANAPVNITIQNKLSVPVFIDWLRSALIVNDKTVSYSTNEMKISGRYDASSYNWGARNGYQESSGHIHASASLPPSVDFMPPKTFLTKNPLAINNEFIDAVPDTAFHRTKYISVEGLTVPVKRATFTEETSPLRFRSFLTFMVGEPTAKPQSFEHTFYVSEIMNTGSAPNSMMLNSEHRGNQFYISKTNKTGVAIGTMAVGAVLMAAVISAGNNNVEGD